MGERRQWLLPGHDDVGTACAWQQQRDDPASCSHAALLSFPWSPGSPWAGIRVFFLMASLGQMRYLYPWEQEGADAPSVRHFMLLLRCYSGTALVLRVRLVSRDVPHLLGAVNNLLHTLHARMLLSHGHVFTVCVSAVIDYDLDPGITKATCLRGRVA